MAETNFDGPLSVTTGFYIGEAGQAGSRTQLLKTTTGISDATATTVLTLTIPNIAQSAVLRILIRSGITTTSHTYDSSRVVMYLVTVTRVAGAAAVVGVSAALGAQIATSSSGQTLTSTLAAAAVSGGVTATNTCALQITNTGSVAGSSETCVFAELLLGTGAQGLGAASPTGITMA